MLDGYVTEDGRTRVVMARPRRPPYDSDFSRALDERVRSIETSVRADRHADARTSADDEPLPPLRVEFAGGHRVALETEALVRRESILNTVGSLVAILPLLFIVFRSLWLVAVGALPTTLSLVIVLGVLGFLGTRLSAAGTGVSAMLFGLGIDGVVLLYVAHLLPTRRDARDRHRLADLGPRGQHAPRHVDDGGDFLRPGVRRLSQPAAARAAGRPQHGDLRRADAAARAGAAAAPRAARARAARWRCRGCRRGSRRIGGSILVTAAVLTGVLGASATRLARRPESRAAAVGHRAPRELEATDRLGVRVADDVYVVLADGVDLDALLAMNERLVQRMTAELPGAPRAGRRRGFCHRRQPRREPPSGSRVRGSPSRPSARRSNRPRLSTASGPVPSRRSPHRLPRLLDTSQRLRYEDYVDHGLDDLIDRFIVRDDGRWQLATYGLSFDRR